MVLQFGPTDSAWNLITDDCTQVIECSAIRSSRLACHDRLFCGCELGPKYHPNSHFESVIHLEENV